MVRIRVRVDPDWLRSRADEVRSGLPGMGHVRTDPAMVWPEFLITALVGGLFFWLALRRFRSVAALPA